jgi:hypothetical protein
MYETETAERLGDAIVIVACYSIGGGSRTSVQEISSLLIAIAKSIEHAVL